MASKANRAHGLISYYELQYKDLHKTRDLDLNRNKHRWGFEAMMDDLGEVGARQVIDFYFAVGQRHSVEHLMYNYEKLNKRMIEIREDEEERERQRKLTEQRVKEWEKKIGNNRG